MKDYQLQVIIAAGKEAADRATLGFAYALGAASAGTHVVLFFTLDGACWIDEANGHQPAIQDFEAIDTYWKLLADMGANFEGCSSCVENYCRQLGAECKTRPGMKLAGLSTAAIRGVSTQTLVF